MTCSTCVPRPASLLLLRHVRRGLDAAAPLHTAAGPFRVLAGGGEGAGQGSAPPEGPKGPPSKDPKAELNLALERAKQWQKESWQKLAAVWSGGQGPVPAGANHEWYAKRVSFWMKRYENFVGLTEVKAAQGKVVKAESAFVESQEVRRETQLQIRDVQEKIKQLHSELEKTHRGEDRYLTLVTQEHQILKEETRLQLELQSHERSERECFSALSFAVRDSHEKERAQAEKTKYWSILGSILGTCLGVVGTTINNRMRMQELRELVSRSTSGGALAEVTENVGKSMESHEARLKELIQQIQHVIIDSKLSLDRIGEMRAISNSLQKTSESFNVDELDSKTSRVLARCEDIYKSLVSQQRLIPQRFNDLAKDLKAQNVSLENAFVVRQQDLTSLAQNAEQRDELLSKNLESLEKSQCGLADAFQSSSQATEEKVSQVLSVIHGLQAAAASRRDREQLLLRGLDVSMLDKIENILEDHESRIRTVTIVSGLFVAVITPAAVYAFNKLW